jgi:hypothetical protein
MIRPGNLEFSKKKDPVHALRHNRSNFWSSGRRHIPHEKLKNYLKAEKHGASATVATKVCLHCGECFYAPKAIARSEEIESDTAKANWEMNAYFWTGRPITANHLALRQGIEERLQDVA